jgi:hypothetical protein
MPCSKAICQAHKSGGAGTPRLTLQVFCSIEPLHFSSHPVHRKLVHPPCVLVATVEMLILLPYCLVSIFLVMFTNKAAYAILLEVL